ncbi:aminopeptidase [Romboutsia hominis]|uniref:aminopeptidase n=1 Tax=Romboutsia hominis TaxID=1507512 RepID=UPI001F066EA5|nr:aminopeptidase [Romboutsia hominis]MCH1958530.1 aminopeptidase [Romboutsia hominis]MCH1970447.1 aminopeptidase [Romboutsia hominis]
MNIDFFKKLSEADGIASNEGEIREVLLEELKDYSDEIVCDRLGSIIFSKIKNEKAPNVMICAHMDEVGFMVRSIDKLGMIHLITIGGVKPLAQFTQKVRITTSEGKKIPAIINGTYNDGKVEKVYADVGAYTAEEVYNLGIQVGDMVTYTTDFEEFTLENRLVGKAFDDRIGCFVMGEVLKRLEKKDINCNVHFAATSSEEVGIRGAKTATQLINPDVVFVIDVACAKNEFLRDHTNQKQIDKGIMLMHRDRTLVPNRKMINYIIEIADKNNISLQHDMFESGGTDGGEAHLVNEGKPCAVTCVPVRYGHCAFSIVSNKDLESIIELYTQLVLNFDEERYKNIKNFI